MRDRVDVHRLMNFIEGESQLLVEMAGKAPANVVSSDHGEASWRG
ncbi:MAG: hypothetical protein WA231_18800 [Methylocella sp.]